MMLMSWLITSSCGRICASRQPFIITAAVML